MESFRDPGDAGNVPVDPVTGIESVSAVDKVGAVRRLPFSYIATPVVALDVGLVATGAAVLGGI